MKKTLLGLVVVISYLAIAIIATGNWVHVELLGAEASYLLRGESMFAAIMWLMMPALLLFTVTPAEKDAEATENNEQPEKM